MDPAMSQERIEEASRESNYTSPREITQKKIGKAEDAKLKIQKDIASALYGFLQKHLIIEILPLHAKVLTIERNMSIRVGLTALHEQKTPHWVVWDSLRGEYDGTLVLKDFLDVSINTNVPSSDEISKHISKYLDEDEEEKIPSEEAVNEDLNAPSTLFNDIAEEMENKSVFQIFEHVKCTKHKIVKIGYDESLKKIWDIMQDQGLKMAALESISDAENKIPSFIQGFLSYNDFLEFFVDNYDGDVKPFERTLTEIDIFYSKGWGDPEHDTIKVVQKDEKLYVVIKKMLEYQILMVPVVQDMESRRTIGLFFLKDVFWLLRSGKYFDQPIHVLLKEIYQDAQKDESDLPECEGEEDSDFGEFLKDEGIDEDGQDFLYELDTESKKSGSKISDNRVRSYNGSKQNMAMDDTMPGTKTKMEFSSANDVYQMNNQSEASKNLRNILSQEESNILQRKESSGGYRLEPETSGKHFPSTDYMRMKNHSHNSKISGRIRARTRGWSINSFKKDFITKKLVAKTKEIYGINRVAIFNPDCTLKEWIEKIMCVPENRLIEIDTDFRVVSILTCSDIISFVSR